MQGYCTKAEISVSDPTRVCINRYLSRSRFQNSMSIHIYSM